MQKGKLGRGRGRGRKVVVGGVRKKKTRRKMF